MSVNSYLDTLDSDIKVSDSEESKIEVSLSTIKSRLILYFGSDVTERKVFGSYDRKTILSRKSDDESDVDLMVVFKNPDGNKPQSFLNRLKSFAEYYYSTSEIHQSSPTIVLELNHIKFELTPAYVSYGTYYIPNGPSNWKSTDPDKLRDNVNESNRNNNYKLKPVLRLLKHWNVNKNYGVMASYAIEDTVATSLKYAYYSCTSYTDYLKRAFESIRYMGTSSDRVKSAMDRIDSALNYEANGYNYLALDEIKKVFPEV